MRRARIPSGDRKASLKKAVSGFSQGALRGYVIPGDAMATAARERRRPHYYDDPRFDYARLTARVPCSAVTGFRSRAWIEWATQERLAGIRFGLSTFFLVGGASLLDPGRDGRGDVDGGADGAQAVMRLLHRVRQQRPGSVALLTAGEPDPERHLDVGQAVAVGVAHLARVDQYLERLGFSPARGQDGDVDSCAAADGDQQQLRRGASGAGARGQGDLAAPAVGGGELAVRDPPDGHAAVHGIIRHAPSRPTPTP